MRKQVTALMGLVVMFALVVCMASCGSASKSGTEGVATESDEQTAEKTSEDGAADEEVEAETKEEKEAAVAPTLEDFITVDGAYWRDAFENDDYSSFDDDEERELFVFFTMKPAEDNIVYLTTGMVRLKAGTQERYESLHTNYGNSYYQPLKDAGFKCLPSITTGVEPYEDPVKYVAQFFVKGWMVKDADVVTLNIYGFSIGDQRISGSFDIPVADIEPVMVDVEGQPTHTSMIEEMTNMALN